MSFNRLIETFRRLPLHTKAIGVGSVAVIIAAFLPWYADMDTYRIGDRFLGVTGPASFIGIVMMGLAGLSLWLFSYHLSGRRMPRLPVREGIVHLFNATESLFLLLLVNSIYFHPKFGVNITLKETQFGMTLAFFGVFAMLGGAYFQNRYEGAVDNQEGRLEPLIKIDPVQAREHGLVMPRTASSSTPAQRSDIPRNFLFGTSAGTGPVGPAPSGQAPRTPEKTDKPSGGGSSMIRMDL